MRRGRCNSKQTMANSLCRLCLSKEQIVNVFHSHLESGAQLRMYILLATGIQIKESDVISKMVCHRCCEIAVKLHKYRTKAVANDKLLKEQYGQPHTTPITDQDELNRVASRLCNGIEHGNTLDTSNSRDALELLNISIKSEAFHEQFSASAPSSLPSEQSVNNVYTSNSVAATPRLNAPPSHAQNSSGITKSTVPVVKSCKITPKICYVHPSVKKLVTEHKHLILPHEAFNSDISPVVSLDKAEVTDWYASQLDIIKKKLSNTIIIKKVPDSSNYQVSNPLHSPSESNIESNHQDLNPTTQCENNTKNSSKSHKSKKRNYRRILDSSDYDSDDIGRDDFQSYEAFPEFSDFIQSSAPKPIDPHMLKIPQASYKPVPRAKKRTARKSYPYRKRLSLKENDTYEVIPQKKKRIYCNKDALSALNKVDLPQQCPADKNAQKAIFTSSLELTPKETMPELVDCQNVLTTGKSLDIFMCPVCSLPCISKKQLMEHERTHLTCKYCQTEVKNVELMKRHLDESCVISLVKDNAIVKLTRVDSLPSVVKKYSEAFQECDISRPSLRLYCNENINNFKEFGINIEETEPAVVFNEPINNYEQTVTNDQTMLALVQHPTTQQTNNKENVPVGITETNKSDDVEVVCISDDSGDELECSVVSRHKIVEIPKVNISIPSILEHHLQNKTIGSTTDVQSKPAPAFPPVEKSLTEKEMIRALFKKYSNSTAQSNNSVQTFTPSNTNIKYTKTNLIILENMFTELLEYKIPIHLESQPKISARFKEEVSPTVPSTLECWVHKVPVDVRKPCVTSVSEASSVTTNSIPSTNLVSSCNITMLPNTIIPTKKYRNDAVPSARSVVTATTKSLETGTVPSTAAQITQSTVLPAPNNILNQTNALANNIVNHSKTHVGGLFNSMPLLAGSLFSKQGTAGNSNISLTGGKCTSTISAVPLQVSLSTSNCLLVPTTAVACATESSIAPINSQPYSVVNGMQQSTNLMQILGTPSRDAIQYQNGNSSYMSTSGTLPTSNIVQFVEPPNNVIQYAPACASQNSLRTNNHTYNTEPIYNISNNVTNVNEFILLSNNMQQSALNNMQQSALLSKNIQESSVLANHVQQAAMQQSNTTMYATSYLNSLAMPPPPSYEQSVQAVATNSTVLSVQNQNLIRVKNLHELTN